MPDAKLRAFWSLKQGLDGSLRGLSAADILSRSGWARSVAGAGPYLTLFSRGGLRRAEIDRALADIEIHELPTARGCTYVLPASDYALGLKVGQPFTEVETKTAMKLGVTEAELSKLRTAIGKALAGGPLDPDALKTAVGPAARNLGPEGVKKGITTTLPVALGTMQSEGEIRRIPMNGRLDQQRYKYTLWQVKPEGTVTDLARRYFQWAGPASVAEFQWFSGLSGKGAKAAMEPLGLKQVQTSDATRFLLPEDVEAFENFQTPRKPQYALVGSLDSINLLRRNLPTLIAPEDEGRVTGSKGRVVDLPNHAIFDRGRLIGLWEFDPAAGAIAWTCFVKPDAALKAAVLETEAFVRDDLGDARGFSLDSPQSRIPKIEALRKAAVA
jgi:hypothetical protein